LRTGVAESADEALDILVRGTQRGANAAEDLLDTYSEYSTQFRNMGLDGSASMGLIQQGLQGGARDADTVADAIKEFSIEAVAGADRVRGGFESLGLNADGLFAALGEGGDSATGALDSILDTLRDVEDPVERNAIAIELFGTKAEDLGDALYALDPSSAVEALGDVRGATDAAGDAMRDNAATRIETFKRALQQGIVKVLGNQVIPAIQGAVGFYREHATAIHVGAAVITAVLLPALIRMGVTSTVQGAKVVGAWIATQASAIAAGYTSAATAARVVAGWLLMGAQATAQGIRMAAAWLIAMGPIPLIIAAVVGLVALIIANWDTIRKWTAQAWDWVWNKIQWVAGKLVDIFLNFTLVGLIIKHWDTIRTKTKEIWNGLVGWVRGIPSRLVSLFLNWTLAGRIIQHWDDAVSGVRRKGGQMLDYVQGIPGDIVDYFSDLGGDMVDIGEDVVRGIWDGIRGMGSWLKNQITGWATDWIPGPISSVLGIGSPSKVMRDQVGRWIPAGIVAGIEAGAPAVDRTMRNLVSVPDRPQFATAASTGAGGTAAGGHMPAVQIEHWHAGSATADQTAAALAWRAKAGG
jgi:hypothetical protein